MYAGGQELTGQPGKSRILKAVASLSYTSCEILLSGCSLEAIIGSAIVVGRC